MPALTPANAASFLTKTVLDAGTGMALQLGWGFCLRMSSYSYKEPNKERMMEKNGHRAHHHCAGVTVRTPAGIGSAFAIDDKDSGKELTQRAVEYFVTKGELAAGPYGLLLVEGDRAVPLPPDRPLMDSDVKEGSVLHLDSCEPQVDG